MWTLIMHLPLRKTEFLNKMKREEMHLNIITSKSGNFMWDFSMETTALLDIGPYSLVELFRRFGGVYCLHYRPDNAVSTNLWNVRLLQREYTALHPRRLSIISIKILLLTFHLQQGKEWSKTFTLDFYMKIENTVWISIELSILTDIPSQYKLTLDNKDTNMFVPKVTF
jgi:hypothetical protein